jgi:hypothetical protein
MDILSSKFGGRIVLILAFIIAVTSNVTAKEGTPEKLGFIATLQAEEDSKYKELTDNIKKMPRGQYQAFLNSRVEKAFSGELQEVAVMVLVDVTTEMNQPESSFLTKLFTTVPDEKNYGKNKAEALLRGSNGKPPKELTFKSGFKGNGNKYFQSVEGMLNQQEAYLLASQNEIVDLHVVDSLDSSNSFLTMHTPTGRIIPRQVQKIYDPEFIQNGLYAELMTKFESKEKMLVQVSFLEPTNFSGSLKELHDYGYQLIEEFLTSWPDYEYQVLHKSTNYILLTTTKKHVLAMKKDARVRSIKKGSFF